MEFSQPFPWEKEKKTKEKEMILEKAYKERFAREERGHPRFYQPLSLDMQSVLHDDYRSRISIPLTGDNQILSTKSGTVISHGYTRVVVGDYGAYIEMSPTQIQHANIQDRFGKRNTPRYPIKYWWMVSRDHDEIKIYEQIKTVPYADYKPGMFYASPTDLYVGDLVTGL
jgi:hypothetical protein